MFIVKIPCKSTLYKLILTKLLDPLRLCSAADKSEAVHAGVLDCGNKIAYFGRSSKAAKGYYEEAKRRINDEDLKLIIKKFIDTTLVTPAYDGGGDWKTVIDTKRKATRSVTHSRGDEERHSAAIPGGHN